MNIIDYIQEKQNEIKNNNQTFGGWKITGIGEKCLKITNPQIGDKFIDWDEFEEDHDKFHVVTRIKNFFNPFVEEENKKELEEALEFIQEDEERIATLKMVVNNEEGYNRSVFEELMRYGFCNYGGSSQKGREVLELLTTSESETTNDEKVPVSKSNIQVYSDTKTELDNLKLTPSETYNEVISRLIESVVVSEDVRGFILTNGLFTITCEAEYEDEEGNGYDHWYFLDELGEKSEFLEVKQHFVDDGIQKEYTEFIRSINQVNDNIVSLIDWGANLDEVGEAQSFKTFTMKRIY
jgi:hypothetical protein